MFCPNCGTNLPQGSEFCSNCGTHLQEFQSQQTIPENSSETMTEMFSSKSKNLMNPIIDKIKNFIKQNKKMCFIILMSLVLLIGGIIVYKAVSNYYYEKNIHYSFKIDGKEFKIGEKVSYYEKKGYTYKDEYYKDTDIIVADGFIPHSFYSDNKAVMYAAIHCKEKENCHYSNGTIVKINFYNNIGEVMLSDFIKIGTTYDEIVSKLGEPDGKFYMNNSEYVWAFYDKGKINNPYYVLEFDSSKKVVRMKIGMWWYDGEYEYTVKK